MEETLNLINATPIFKLQLVLRIGYLPKSVNLPKDNLTLSLYNRSHNHVKAGSTLYICTVSYRSLAVVFRIHGI